MSLNTRLFVGNLPNDTNESELRSAFSAYGKLVNLDLKSKPDVEQDKKVFAFVTLSSSNYEVESCIKDFSNNELRGHKLYVTRARESFLERLQRERQEAQNKKNQEQQHVVPEPALFTDRKTKIKSPHTSPIKEVNFKQNKVKNVEKVHIEKKHKSPFETEKGTNGIPSYQEDKKKIDSDKKRLESLKRKRQDFKDKQNIIKSGLVGIDKVQNKKIKFNNDDEPEIPSNLDSKHKQNNVKSQKLFEDNDDDSDGDVNFNVKEQFEGVKGQKVLDLQSRYKSDKRFVLDERFIEDETVEETGKTNENQPQVEEDVIDPGTADEKSKQLSILQDVLGVAVTARTQDQPNKKTKTRMGMLRFDPLQPEHAKHLAPIDETKQEIKKSKKKKNKDKKVEEETPVPIIEENKVEVSKEQFYKVSETLKEVIEQPTTFSLRSLFTKEIEESAKDMEQEAEYIPLESKDSKRKNPLEPGTKNPFMYDSSESEAEDEGKQKDVQPLPQNTTTKAVWKENLFFTESDVRFSEALAFFNTNDNREHKERRELKSLMKKRICNKERKNQMFQKKIGGRKKTMKKSYRKK